MEESEQKKVSTKKKSKNGRKKRRGRPVKRGSNARTVKKIVRLAILLHTGTRPKDSEVEQVAALLAEVL